MFNKPKRRLVLLVALLALGLAACVPGAGPGIRIIDGQTWSARFDVNVNAAGANIKLPVDLALTFSQRINQVSAKATLEYNAGIFRLQTPGIIDLDGRLGIDDHLSLESGSGALTFDGSFVGERLVGTVSIAGVVPVSNVTFTRSR